MSAYATRFKDFLHSKGLQVVIKKTPLCFLYQSLCLCRVLNPLLCISSCRISMASSFSAMMNSVLPVTRGRHRSGVRGVAAFTTAVMSARRCIGSLTKNSAPNWPKVRPILVSIPLCKFLHSDQKNDE